jgi:peroxiredoxin
MIRDEIRWLAILAVMTGSVAIAQAGKFNKKLSVGDTAPAWSDLAGIDGKRHSVKDYDSKLLVVVFTCNQCPVASEYQDRLNTLAKDYKNRGVSVVAINANRGKGESLEKMAKRAEKESFAFDYLKDETQASAKAYGARTTPTVFLLDAERKIAYMGAVDDNWQAEKAVEHHYLLDAIQAVLDGKKPDVRETLATGCAISFREDDD